VLEEAQEEARDGAEEQAEAAVGGGGETRVGLSERGGRKAQREEEEAVEETAEEADEQAEAAETGGERWELRAGEGNEQVE
jgi:hypothetical protein